MFFVLLFVKKKLKVFLAFGIFLSIFPAIDVKKLLKWLAIKKSSDVVLLPIFFISWRETFLDDLVLMRVFTPYHIFFESFLLVSKNVMK